MLVSIYDKLSVPAEEDWSGKGRKVEKEIAIFHFGNSSTLSVSHPECYWWFQKLIEREVIWNWFKRRYHIPLSTGEERRGKVKVAICIIPDIFGLA